MGRRGKDMVKEEKNRALSSPAPRRRPNHSHVSFFAFVWICTLTFLHSMFWPEDGGNKIP
jgi:hypothetical protein